MTFDSKAYQRTYQRGYYHRNIEENRERSRLSKIRYRERLGEKYNEMMREYNQRNRDSLRIKRIVRVYGISKEKLEEIIKTQNGLCAICGLPETSVFRRGGDKGRTKNLSVDHCHKTGKVRGLLCQKCNQGLGLLSHDRDHLLKAVEYLRNYE